MARGRLRKAKRGFFGQGEGFGFTGLTEFGMVGRCSKRPKGWEWKDGMNGLRRMRWCWILVWSFGFWVQILFPAGVFAQPPKSSYPLEQMPLLRLVLRLLQRLYIDPTQFDAQKMHRAGLEGLENRLPEVLVIWPKDAKRFTVRLGEQQESWLVPKFIGLFDVWLRLQPVAAFVQKHYRGDISMAEIEYAMVLGVMSTLDQQTRVVSRAILMRQKALQPVIKTGRLGVVLVLTPKSDALVVQQVLTDSPAALAGLQPEDRVVAVDGEQVRGQTMIYWRNKLLGFRGTRVSLHVQRKGWSTPRKIVLIRAHLTPPLVEGVLLPGQFGYVRLRQFSEGASLFIREELARLRRANKGDLLGLVLDLRDNPGGLIDEAVKICGMFVESGQVVTYAGANVPRRTLSVSGQNVEGLYPLVVLLNERSASASELLAGALQGHQRALVLGQRSYGKGTVQSVSQLGGLGLLYRITIAQYLVPPERSIQMVGIAPDIQLTPVVLDPKQPVFESTPLRDQAERVQRWPTFLQQNLDPEAKSLFTIRYLSRWKSPHWESQTKSSPAASHKPKGKKPRTRKNNHRRPKGVQPWRIDPNSRLSQDVEVWIARYLLAHAQSGRRDLFLQKIKTAIVYLQQEQEQQIVAGLQSMGIDWRQPIRSRKSQTSLQVHIEPVEKTGSVWTGKPFQLRITVKNSGQESAYRVRTMVHTRLRVLRYRELLWGRIQPGQSVSRVLQVTLPRILESGAEQLEFHWQGVGIKPMPPTLYTLRWNSKTRPRYHIAYVQADPSPDGNGDGQIQAGETIHWWVTVKSVGSPEPTQPELQLVVEQASLVQSRLSLGTLLPGQSRTVVFTMHVSEHATPGFRYAHLILTEKHLGMSRRYRLPLVVAPPLWSWQRNTSSWVTCPEPTTLFATASRSGSPVARLGKGSRVRIVRRFQQAIQLEIPAPHVWSKSLVTHVPTLLSLWTSQHSCLPTTHTSALVQDLQWLYQLEPPVVHGLPMSAVVTEGKQYKLSLTLHSAHGIRDVVLFRQRKKIDYRPIRYNQPGTINKQSLEFMLPLKQGLQRFRLFVRTTQGSFVYPFHVSSLPKPKNSR